METRNTAYCPEGTRWLDELEEGSGADELAELLLADGAEEVLEPLAGASADEELALVPGADAGELNALDDMADEDVEPLGAIEELEVAGVDRDDELEPVTLAADEELDCEASLVVPGSGVVPGCSSPIAPYSPTAWYGG